MKEVEGRGEMEKGQGKKAVKGRRKGTPPPFFLLPCCTSAIILLVSPRKSQFRAVQEISGHVTQMFLLIKKKLTFFLIGSYVKRQVFEMDIAILPLKQHDFTEGGEEER